MSLINLENEVKKNYIQLKFAEQKYNEVTNNEPIGNLLLVTLEKNNALELYVSTADKLAALISSEFLTGQFKKRDWKSEYSEIFIKVYLIHQAEYSIITGKDQMINNINKLLKEWNVSLDL